LRRVGYPFCSGVKYESETHDPPAPFLSVRVTHPLYHERFIEIPAKVDSGADVIAIPVEAVNQLGLQKAGSLTVAGFNGQAVQVVLYAVRIELPTNKAVRMTALTIPSNYVLVGRDVLNSLRVLLDGPELTLEILQ